MGAEPRGWTGPAVRGNLASVRRLLLLASVVAVATLGTADARAATRYATPDGSGAVPCDDPAAPCSLPVALSAAAPGDVVAAGAGEHHLAANLLLATAEVSVQGPAPGTPAVVVIDGDFPAFYVSAPGVTLRDLDLRGATTSDALIDNAPGTAPTYERLAIRQSGTATALALRGGLLRDSLVTSQAGTGQAVLAAAARVVNATVLAPAGAARALGVVDDPGATGEVTVVRNSILQGGETGADLEATDGSANLDVDRTSLDPSRVSQAGEGRVALGPGTQDRRTRPPLLDALTGRELPGSPTEDAGAPDPALGAFALDGTPRAVGAPDLGADERTKAPGVLAAGGAARRDCSTSSAVTLTGVVTPNGLPTSAAFELDDGGRLSTVPATPAPGAGALGVPVTATTRSAAPVTASLVATNADGTSRTPVAWTVGAAPPCVPAPDRLRPRLGRPTLARRLGRGRSAQVAFSLSETARLRLVVERVRTGRRAAGACRLHARRGARCTRSSVVASASRIRHAGRIRAGLPLRPHGRALPVGSYRLTLGATDAAGNRAVPRHVRFRIG